MHIQVSLVLILTSTRVTIKTHDGSIAKFITYWDKADYSVANSKVIYIYHTLKSCLGEGEGFGILNEDYETIRYMWFLLPHFYV
jgi:hypothetical protein